MNLRDQPDLELDEVLIQKASEGSLDSFNQLVLRYQDLAYRRAYALTGDAASSDDITQESFIKAFLNIGRFRGGSFRAWLLKIVANTAYDLFRRSGKHRTQSLYRENDNEEELESPSWFFDPSASVEAIVEQNEDSKRLNQLLDELPDIYRNVLALVDLFGLDYWEAAKVLNIPIGTVKSRLARARVQLGRKLQENFEYFLPANPMVPANAS